MCGECLPLIPNFFKQLQDLIFLIYAPQQRRNDAVMARRLYSRIEVRVVFQDKPKQDSVKAAAITWKLIAGSLWWLRDLQRSLLCEPNRFGQSPDRHSMF